MIVTCTLWACALFQSGAYTPPNLHKVRTGENFATISKMYGIGYETLAKANPTIPANRLQPGVAIVIPARLDRPEPRPGPGEYAVTNGDTDWSIARRFGITPKALRQMNPNVDWLKLQIGQRLNVPRQAEPAAPSAPLPMTAASLPAKPSGAHTVVSGESDWLIARRYGMTVRELHSLNPGVNWDALPLRTKLTVRKPAAAQAAHIPTKRVKVVRSDVVVRAGARKDSSRVGIVDLGRVATVRDRIDDWYKLSFDGGTVGWVRGDMLAPVYASSIYAVERTTPRSRPVTAQPSALVRRSPAAARPAPASRPAPAVREPASQQYLAMRDVQGGSLIDTARGNLGVRYRWGGTSRSGFDCSGLTTYVYKTHGKSLPRTAAEQSRQGQAVGKGELKQGDLVFFRTRGGSRVSHVGIYVGDGKFIHASSGSGRVVTSSLNEGYYSRRYAGARRVANVGSKGATAKGVREPEPGAEPKSAAKPKVPAKPEAPIQDSVEKQVAADQAAKSGVPDATGR